MLGGRGRGADVGARLELMPIVSETDICPAVVAGRGCTALSGACTAAAVDFCVLLA